MRTKFPAYPAWHDALTVIELLAIGFVLYIVVFGAWSYAAPTLFFMIWIRGWHASMQRDFLRALLLDVRPEWREDTP